MKLKELDRSGLSIIFILGGLYGLTDYYRPNSVGTFIGSGLAMMVISFIIGWVFNKILRRSIQYKNKTEHLKNKIKPTIIFAMLFSVIMLIRGVIEFISYL